MTSNCSRSSIALNSRRINWFWKIRIATQMAVIGVRPVIRLVAFAVICIDWRWTMISPKRIPIDDTIASNARIIRTRKWAARSSIIRKRFRPRCCVAANAAVLLRNGTPSNCRRTHWSKACVGNWASTRIAKRCWTAISSTSTRMVTTFWWNGNAMANWFDKWNWMDRLAIWPTRTSWRIQCCVTNTFRWTTKMARWLSRPRCPPMLALTIASCTKIRTVRSRCNRPSWRSLRSWDSRRNRRQSNWKWEVSGNCIAKSKELQHHKSDGSR